jgi:hypothetical protein
MMTLTLAAIDPIWEPLAGFAMATSVFGASPFWWS